MVKRLSADLMVPQLMRLLRFHGGLTVESIRVYTSLGRASIRTVLDSMIRYGLLNKVDGKPVIYELSENSKYWLGWNSF